MRKRIIFGVLLAMVLCLVPVVSQARWMNTNTGRFQTMDSYEGHGEDSLNLNKYLRAYALDEIDAAGGVGCKNRLNGRLTGLKVRP